MRISSFRILKGRLLDGGLLDILQGDQHYLSMQLRRTWYQPTTLAGGIELEAVAAEDDPLLLRLDLQTRSDGLHGRVRQRVSMYDFASQRWTLMEDGEAEPDDHTIRVETKDRPGRFIEDGTLRVLARIRWEATQSSPSTESAIHIDQAEWHTLH